MSDPGGARARRRRRRHAADGGAGARRRARRADRQPAATARGRRRRARLDGARPRRPASRRGPSAGSAPLDVAGLPAAFADEVDVDEYYALLRSIGLTYGPTFRGLTTLRRRDGAAVGLASAAARRRRRRSLPPPPGPARRLLPRARRRRRPDRRARRDDMFVPVAVDGLRVVGRRRRRACGASSRWSTAAPADRRSRPASSSFDLDGCARRHDRPARGAAHAAVDVAARRGRAAIRCTRWRGGPAAARRARRAGAVPGCRRRRGRCRRASSPPRLDAAGFVTTVAVPGPVTAMVGPARWTLRDDDADGTAPPASARCSTPVRRGRVPVAAPPTPMSTPRGRRPGRRDCARLGGALLVAQALAERADDGHLWFVTRGAQSARRGAVVARAGRAVGPRSGRRQRATPARLHAASTSTRRAGRRVRRCSPPSCSAPAVTSRSPCAAPAPLVARLAPLARRASVSGRGRRTGSRSPSGARSSTWRCCRRPAGRRDPARSRSRCAPPASTSATSSTCSGCTRATPVCPVPRVRRRRGRPSASRRRRARYSPSVDAVIGIAPRPSTATWSRRADLLVAEPAGLTFAEAATVPIAFLTAAYGLRQLAASAARRAGADPRRGRWRRHGGRAARPAHSAPRSTPPSAARRSGAYLEALGVRHIYSSRTPRLRRRDPRRHRRRRASTSCSTRSPTSSSTRSFDVLAPAGRFLEIGKRGIWSAERAAADRPDGPYHRVRPRRLPAPTRRRPRLRCRRSPTTSPQARITPLPLRAFPAEAIEAGVPVHGPGPPHRQGRRRPTARRRPTSDHDGAYLVTGGLGGLGLGVAGWLVEHGARQRRPHRSPAAVARRRAAAIAAPRRRAGRTCASSRPTSPTAAGVERPARRGGGRRRAAARHLPRRRRSSTTGPLGQQTWERFEPCWPRSSAGAALLGRRHARPRPRPLRAVLVGVGPARRARAERLRGRQHELDAIARRGGRSGAARRSASTGARGPTSAWPPASTSARAGSGWRRAASASLAPSAALDVLGALLATTVGQVGGAADRLDGDARRSRTAPVPAEADGAGRRPRRRGADASAVPTGARCARRRRPERPA